MAKITSIELLTVPKFINVGEELNEISIQASVEFHPIDLKLNMEYRLHLYVFDIHGAEDTPVILPNWDESEVLTVVADRADDFLGKTIVKLEAKEQQVDVACSMQLQLGKFNPDRTYMDRNIEVFSTLIPVIASSSKRSKACMTRIRH